jgi:hypothetical protein
LVAVAFLSQRLRKAGRGRLGLPPRLLKGIAFLNQRLGKIGRRRFGLLQRLLQGVSLLVLGRRLVGQRCGSVAELAPSGCQCRAELLDLVLFLLQGLPGLGELDADSNGRRARHPPAGQPGDATGGDRRDPEQGCMPLETRRLRCSDDGEGVGEAGRRFAVTPSHKLPVEPVAIAQ